MARVLAVIPSRYGSSRFPGKPLALIAGVPMIVRVLRAAQSSAAVDRVLVATDDERIAAVVRAAGGEAVMTDPEIPSGTDRVCAAARGSDEEIVINVQGDEPALNPAVLDALVAALDADPAADLATPVVRQARAFIQRTDQVTCVAAQDGHAIYFSRSVIPYGAETVLQHIGIYAYRRPAIERFVALPQPPLERSERLEQLRALDAGMRILAVEVDSPTTAVDRPEDVQRVEAVLAGAAAPGGGLAAVRLLVLDVDGVLTDGRVTYVEGAEQALSFDIKDGFGLVALRRAGVQVALLTGRGSAALDRRARELGIEHVLSGVEDKPTALRALAESLGCALEAVCYVGDDDPDLAAMAVAGISAAPADASVGVLEHATIRLSKDGGRGAVRELADRIIAAVATVG